MIEYLYHGTSSQRLAGIMEKGIRPRGKLTDDFAGRWGHTVASNPRAVYLSAAYAPYFAMVAADKDGGLPLVLEIEVAKLNSSLLAPDEDALEQGTRGSTFPKGNPLFCPRQGMKARTMWYRARALKLARTFPDLWEQSLRALGTCAYYGVISWAAVAQKYEFPDSVTVWRDWGDPTITTLNFMILGKDYVAKTAKLFGRGDDAVGS